MNNLHICKKCKGDHSYINCKHMILYCPICKINMKSVQEFILHQFDHIHIKRVHCLKKILHHEYSQYNIIIDN